LHRPRRSSTSPSCLPPEQQDRLQRPAALPFISPDIKANPRPIRRRPFRPLRKSITRLRQWRCQGNHPRTSL
jgi:hypothetical protein